MSDATIPKWRSDFPYTSDGEDEVTRREFARYLVLASASFAAASVGVAAWTSLRTINRGAPRAIVAASTVPPGEAYLFRYPTELDPAILVHLPDGELRAFSQKCTHLGCVVYWKPAREEMFCPCHDGVFDARSGIVLAGPPQRPLGRIAVERRADGMIWALGEEVHDGTPA
ncbi:MAG: Rieske (2Fe-2S) protein [Thermodesulfobacteriota bacterium]